MSRKGAKIFISYSRRDQKWVDRLRKHLSIFRGQEMLDPWYDRAIEPGEKWTDKLDKQLKSADIILLMISADFLSSDIARSEMEQALARHDAGEAAVIPVILKPCLWENTPIANLQALPRDAMPISVQADKNQALFETSREIQRIASTAAPSEGLDEERQVELRLNTDFASFSPEQEKRLISGLREHLNLDHDPKILEKRQGSVILRLSLSSAEVERLQRAVNNGELGEYNIVEAEVVVEEEGKVVGGSVSGLRPRIFIGSSSEGLEVAETIQLNLDHTCEVTIWTQGFFNLGGGTLETLVDKLADFDYAILILTPDDMTESRGQALFSPRDNVIFELGLFMGYLGRERTIIVYDRTADLKIPADLAGITAATYQPHSSGNLEAALGAPCTKLKKHIQVHGVRGAPNAAIHRTHGLAPTCR